MQAECLPGDLPIDSATRGVWWVASKDGEPCAFCCFEDLGLNVGYLTLVAVMPHARGHGLQRRLMAVALRYARSIGTKVMVSYTAPWNHPSSNNFIADQWRLYTPEYKWGWDDGLYWRKEL